jgi:hypothetical protein
VKRTRGSGRRRLLDYLTIHGVFLAVLAPGLLWCAWRWRGHWTPGRRLVMLLTGLALVLTLVPRQFDAAVRRVVRGSPCRRGW